MFKQTPFLLLVFLVFLLLAVGLCPISEDVDNYNSQQRAYNNPSPPLDAATEEVILVEDDFFIDPPLSTTRTEWVTI